MTQTGRPIRVAHVLFRFSIGGLENGVVNLINRLDPRCYTHDIVCLTDYDPEFVRRVTTANIACHALHKKEGQDPALWWRLYRLFRALDPDVVHTRNFVALEAQIPAVCAGVRGRVHGEHGWDVQDVDGTRRKYQIARRVLGFGVRRFIALSKHLQTYLVERVGIPGRKVVQIYNGVDRERFHPAPARAATGDFVIGTVGRMSAVKNQTLLVTAFVDLIRRRPALAETLRLKLVGSGPLLAECQTLLASAGLGGRADIVGSSDRVPEELRSMDLFVLPSLAEGISNTILEAMASGLPVIAAAVGGNPELVIDGATGTLVPSADAGALSRAIETYVDDRALRARHAAAGQRRVAGEFSLDDMVAAYDALYRGLAGPVAQVPG